MPWGTIAVAVCIVLCARFIWREICKAAARPNVGHDYMSDENRRRRLEQCRQWNAAHPTDQVFIPNVY